MRQATKALTEINSRIHSRLSQSGHWERYGPKSTSQSRCEEDVSVDDVQGLLQRLNTSLFKTTNSVEPVDLPGQSLEEGIYKIE